MLQWNLYGPAFAGAVNVADSPAFTLTLKLLPSSEVTVCVTSSLFFTVTVAPLATELVVNLRSLMVIAAVPVSELLFELPLLLHAANAKARSATHAPRRIREERVFFVVGILICTESLRASFNAVREGVRARVRPRHCAGSRSYPPRSSWPGSRATTAA